MMLRRLADHPDVEIKHGTTVEAVEPRRLLLGHAGDRGWLDVAGPIVVSQGTVPRPVPVTPGRRRTLVVGEAGFAGSAAEAIRQASAITV
ncbi:hypothetical protein [Actinoplanes sp. NPDC089786]